MIPFQIPNITGKEITYLDDVIKSGHLSGNGKYTNLCQNLFKEKYNINKSLLTNSCTSALEMTALLLNIQAGDEIIVPSFTYVSSVNPFLVLGAKIIFADSKSDSPNIDTSTIKNLITKKTKAIVIVHYAGISCDMDNIISIAKKNSIWIIEDAAHAQGAKYKGKNLGSIGHFGTLSFHATKNITSGEGGLLMINDSSFIERAEIIWEKGTNRQKFLRGKVNKYEWCDIGSSFYPSELTAAFLWAQLEKIDEVNTHRLALWNKYANGLANVQNIEIPKIPSYASHNAHLFYLKLNSKTRRDQLILDLKKRGVESSFHYMALHKSPFWSSRNKQRLPNAKMWEDTIIRLPLYYDLGLRQVDFIIENICQLMES